MPKGTCEQLVNGSLTAKYAAVTDAARSRVARRHRAARDPPRRGDRAQPGRRLVRSAQRELLRPAARARTLSRRCARTIPSACTALGCRWARPIRSTRITSARSCGSRASSSRCSSPSILSWGSAGGRFTNDLLPLPYTEEALRSHGRARAARCRTRSAARCSSRTCRAICSSRTRTIAEWEFLAALTRAVRLRAAARREQRLRQRDESRLRRACAI